MDHRYIDQRSVAERYLNHTLSFEERAEFETHLVDCQECTDRLLLAEMFQHRNGGSHPEPDGKAIRVPQTMPGPAPESMRVRFVRQFSPWQLFLILAGAAITLVLVTAGLLIWVR